MSWDRSLLVRLSQVDVWVHGLEADCEQVELAGQDEAGPGRLVLAMNFSVVAAVASLPASFPPDAPSAAP
jgi:hypothetical protein